MGPVDSNPVRAIDVARYLVKLAIEQRVPLSNLQLQKILFFLQREWMRNTGSPLFEDDFEAWQYGPVIRAVYNVFSVFGGEKIADLDEIDYFAELYGTDSGDESRLTADQIDSIASIATIYFYIKPWDLVEMSHKEDGAWALVYGDGSGYGRCIPKQTIIDHG